MAVTRTKRRPSAPPEFDQRMDQQIENTRAAVRALCGRIPDEEFANIMAEVNALVSGVYYLRDVVIG